MKRFIATILSILLMVAPALAEEGTAGARTPRTIIEELAVYYGTYGTAADEKAEELLDELYALDPDLGLKWKSIMQLWENVNTNPEINEGILPDGLPDTDELCLVVLGFQLNPDGSMKEELIQRLTVAKACAEKYPNAYIVCTGGGTAAENQDATEAGEMANWLIANGTDPNRVIVENQSLTTAQNAIYTYRILTEQYPQVKQLAIISSDYHIATGTLLFGAEAILQAKEAGQESMTVVSNAVWHAPSGALSTMFQAGALIELSGDTDTAFEIYYENYDIHELPALEHEESGFVFSEWNPEAQALTALITYVEDVTDESSPNYIPPQDRIAVFDMDGTLCGELYPTYLEYYLLARRIFCDPSYQADEEMLEFGRILRDHALDKSFPDGMDVLHGQHAARAYAGLTLTEFADFVTNQLVREVDGFEGMTYANTFYLPMIEVVEYLQEYDFIVYVVSGSDRFICRTFIEGVLDVPYERIIGMDVDVEATNEDGEDGLRYIYTSEDNIVRTDRLLIKNLKMNKVKAIVREIGRQPVLSFGNSSGDVSMHNYTIFNNRYRSLAFMLIADDEARDYGNTEKVQPLKEKWEESGYIVISMKDDFRTIYGDNVVKTGSFRWLEEFADSEEPAGEPAP